jgi:hypothetical protein
VKVNYSIFLFEGHEREPLYLLRRGKMRKLTIAIAGLSMVLFLQVYPAFATDWRVPDNFATIQEAVDGASAGDRILVGPGYWYGATVNKRLEIEGADGAWPGIIDGPISEDITSGIRLVEGSAGSKISHMQFEVVKIGVCGDHVDNVTVTQCNFFHLGQAVLCFSVNGWKITDNTIRDPKFVYGTPQMPSKGGSGIVLVSRAPGDNCTVNLIANNRIFGKTTWTNPFRTPVAGVAGFGIMLLRQVTTVTPGIELSHNLIINNDIELEFDEELSNLGNTMKAVAFRDLKATSTPAIYENIVAFNDCRGTRLLFFTNVDVSIQDILANNTISRNLAGDQ